MNGLEYPYSEPYAAEVVHPYSKVVRARRILRAFAALVSLSLISFIACDQSIPGWVAVITSMLVAFVAGWALGTRL